MVIFWVLTIDFWVLTVTFWVLILFFDINNSFLGTNSKCSVLTTVFGVLIIGFFWVPTVVFVYKQLVLGY